MTKIDQATNFLLQGDIKLLYAFSYEGNQSQVSTFMSISVLGLEL